MDNTPLKKVKMMDIVRKKPAREEINPLLGKAQQEQFANERRREALQAEVSRKEAMRPAEHLAAEPVAPVQEVPKAVEPTPVVEHAAPRILETHVSEESVKAVPELSSLEMDRPIAYIPKEKPSREEKKMLERMERRERTHKTEKPKRKMRGAVTWVAVCLLLGMVAYLAVAVLPRAEMVLVPKKTNWEYANVIGASTKIAEVDSIGRQIPVAVFLEKKTSSFKFPATGSGKSIERKATGKATIYNEFSESSQPLVAGTRLETSDGKIFRLRERVVVPGATKTGGELIPASIEVDVIADKAGELYNIGPVGKFTIPGFAGTAKFEGFYAESKDPMTGGFVGEGKYPTETDIQVAKESARSQMQGVIESFLQALVLDGFKTIESSRKYIVTKEMVNEAVDEEGNFSIYIEAEGGVDALKEEHVLELMTALARQAKSDEVLHIKTHSLSYGDIAVDAKTGAISLPVDFKGVFWQPIDVTDFKAKILGKTEDELKAFIFSSTSVEKADVSLWPFWVKAVPNETERVKVELQ